MIASQKGTLFSDFDLLKDVVWLDIAVFVRFCLLGAGHFSMASLLA